MRTIVELEDTENFSRPPYAKFKLDLAYNDDSRAFKVFEQKEALQFIRYMTKHRVVINFSKLYAMKMSSGSEKKKFGIVLQAIAIECSNQTVPKAKPFIEFFDDDDKTPFNQYMI